MLLSLTVRNFRSFKSQQTISFLLREHERSEKSRRIERESKAGKVRILKNAMIYGANASGKSNLFFAIIQLSDLVLQPTQHDQQGLLSDSFAGNSENVFFEVQFLKKQAVFTYSLEYNQKEVVYERLLKEGELVFERHYQNFRFRSMDPELQSLTATIRQTSLALYFAQNINITAAKEAFSWFYGLRHFPISDLAQTLQMDPRLKEKLLYALRFADFNITNIEIEQNQRPYPDFPSDLASQDKTDPADFPAKIRLHSVTEIYLTHENHGQSFRLLLQNESEGTQQFFNFMLILLASNKTEEYVIFSDEFDKSLHPVLAESFIKLINSPDNQVQFISTSHNSSLMDQLQKHQIYFVEKDSQGESEVYKLSDFEEIGKVRRDSKFSVKYNSGLFGASQVINEAGLLRILEDLGK